MGSVEGMRFGRGRGKSVAATDRERLRKRRGTWGSVERGAKKERGEEDRGKKEDE